MDQVLKEINDEVFCLSRENKIQMYKKVIKLINFNAEELEVNEKMTFIKMNENEQKILDKLVKDRSIFFEIAKYWLYFEFKRFKSNNGNSYWKKKYLGVLIHILMKID